MHLSPQEKDKLLIVTAALLGTATQPWGEAEPSGSHGVAKFSRSRGRSRWANRR